MARTVEEAKEANREAARKHSRKKHAEAAIAAGREPYKPGRPVTLTDEERVANRLASKARYREKNAERLNAQSAEIQRKKRADRAIAEGRIPGQTGQYPREVVPEEIRVERIRTTKRNFERRHPERAHQRYLSNRDAIKARAREHEKRLKETDPDKHRAQNLAMHNNRRARIKEAGGTFTATDVQWLWDQQHGNCCFCLEPLDRKTFHVDHYIPIARGGRNDRGNLRLLHAKCNQEKSWRDPIDHAREHGMLLW